MDLRVENFIEKMLLNVVSILLGLLFLIFILPGFASARVHSERSTQMPIDTSSGDFKIMNAEQSIKASREEILPKGISKKWFSSVQEKIEKSTYQIKRDEKHKLSGLSALYQSTNQKQGFQTDYTPEGLKVLSPAKQKTLWEWTLALKKIGYADNMKDVPDATIRAFGNRIEYQRGALTEWYVNDAQGLEQGFTLFTPPSQEDKSESELVLEMEMKGSLKAELTGDSVSFTDSKKEPVIRYSKLFVFDAENRTLPAHFALEDRKLLIIVDDEKAVYPLTIDPLITSPSWVVDGEQANAMFGYSVSSAGDVNGDGFDDVIVGAKLYDNGVGDEGAVFVYHGSASGLSSTADWVVLGNQPGARLGASVSSAGDVNADGFADVIVGANLYDNGEMNEGAAFVHYGSANGLSNTPDWMAEGNKAYANFGHSVSSAGNVNGDVNPATGFGYDDVIIGAYQYNQNDAGEGAAFVFQGSATGLSSVANWSGTGDNRTVFFGYSVSSAGDVNGDGFDDIIVGASRFDNNEAQSDEGAAFVYYGASAGLGGPDIPATADWSAEGELADARFGSSVSSAGDVNGDGFDDVIIGAPFYPAFGQSGSAFVFHGSFSGLSAPASPATADWNTHGEEGHERYGVSVSSAGDVNGDGFDDIIVGADLYDPPPQPLIRGLGRVSVYFGANSGLSTIPDWRATGERFGSQFGSSVSSAGDVNGDGLDDLTIGAKFHHNGIFYGGRALVYHGAATGALGGGAPVSPDTGTSVPVLDPPVLDPPVLDPPIIDPAIVDPPVSPENPPAGTVNPGGNTLTPIGNNPSALGETVSETATLLNTPPSAFTLIAPANNASGLPSTITFLWKKAIDPEGDLLSYRFCLRADNPNFDPQLDCVDLSANSATITKTILSVSAGASGVGFLWLGFVLPAWNIREEGLKRHRLWLVLLFFSAGLLLASCGGSGGDASAPAAQQSENLENALTAAEDELSHLVSGLRANTTYHWKVIVKDSQGLTTETLTRDFTTE